MTNLHEFMNLEDLNVNQYIAPQVIPEKPKEPLAAQIVSIILHPLFMGIYGLIFLFVFTDFGILFATQFWHFFTPVLMLSCIVPASGIFILKRLGLISSYGLENKNERFIPFLITFLSYGSLIYFFCLSGLHVFFLWFITLFIIPFLLLIISSIINIWWKISVHMIGIGSLLGSVLSVCYNVKGLNIYPLFIILFILAGCLAVSRLILNRHTPAQVYAGFLLGISVSYLCIWASAKYAIVFLKMIINS